MYLLIAEAEVKVL